jgi:hypothetical protein
VTRRGLSMTGRVRSVAAAVKRRTLGLCTGTSGRSRDRCIRSCPRGTTEREGLIGHGGASDQLRSDMSGHEKPSLDCL